MKKLKKLSRTDLKDVVGGKGACSSFEELSPVYTWCGNDYYICAGNYSTPKELNDAIHYFNEQKC